MESTITTSTLPSEALGMGSPIAEYRTAIVRIWGGILFMSIVGLGFIFVGIMASGEDDGTRALIICGILGLAFIAYGISQFIQAVRNRNLRVVVLEKGLVRTGVGKPDVVNWDDITSVLQEITVHYRNGIKTNTTHKYTLTLANGNKLVFNDVVKNVEALGNTIQQETTRRLLPKYLQMYNSGSPITFGKLTFDKLGITRGKETIPWNQVADIKAERGMISIKIQGKKLDWMEQVAAMPNLFVFLSLVDEILRVNQSANTRVAAW